jgi:phage gpG-like protein
MAGGIGIKVTTGRVEDRLDAYREAVGATRKLLTAIGLRQLKWIADNFRAAGLEEKWPPLAPSTVLGRRRGSSEILQDTGTLRASFTARIRERSVVVGTNVFYAEFHEKGTKPYVITVRSKKVLANKRAGLFFGKRVDHPGLPRRPMLPRTPTGERLAREVIEAALERARRTPYRRVA